MSRRTHRSPLCRNVDVKVSSRQPDQPIILIGLPWRPAPDRAHQLRPPTLCLPSVVSGSIRRVAPQRRRTDSSLPQRVYHPHRHTGVAAARRRHLHVGDHLHGVPLFARLRHLHLVPLPLVSAVGHLRVVRRLHRARPHLLRLLQRDRHLTLFRIVVIGSGTTVPVPAHVALLPPKASPTVRPPPSLPPQSHGTYPPAGTRLAHTPTAGDAPHLNVRPRTSMLHRSP